MRLCQALPIAVAGLSKKHTAVSQWTQELLGGHLGPIPRHRGAYLHRACDPLLDAVRLMERAQGYRRHAQAHMDGAPNWGGPSRVVYTALRAIDLDRLDR